MCPSVHPSVCPSVCLSVRLFTFEVPFKCLFVPTSWRQMFKKFRVSESLGKSNWKKWSKILKFLQIKDVKSPHKKSFFLANFVLLRKIFLVLVLLSILVEIFFVSRMRDLFLTFINNLFWNFTIASWILFLPYRVEGTTISHMQCNLCCTSHIRIVSSKVVFYNLFRKIVKLAATILVMWTLF